MYNLTISIFGKEVQAYIIETGDYIKEDERLGEWEVEYGSYAFNVNGKTYQGSEDGSFDKNETFTIEYLPFRPQNNRVSNKVDGFYKDLFASVFILLCAALPTILSLRDHEYEHSLER